MITVNIATSDCVLCALFIIHAQLNCDILRRQNNEKCGNYGQNQTFRAQIQTYTHMCVRITCGRAAAAADFENNIGWLEESFGSLPAKELSLDQGTNEQRDRVRSGSGFKFRCCVAPVSKRCVRCEV